MTRLSQIIAVEKGVKSDTARQLAEARTEVSNPARLSGISRTYLPRDDEGDQLPPEATRVQVRTEDVLASVATSLTRLLDVTLTKDAANCTAAADVKVGGKVLLEKVPVTYLLFLEKQLGEIAAFVGRLPLLDPAEEWAQDGVSGSWRTTPAKTVRSKKVLRNHVSYEATKEHPAQVQVYPEDVPAGDWTTVKFSGAIPASRARQIADRITVLQEAVKFAREEANAHEITDRKAGAAVFGYLLAG
jgi:hypothetical protein